MNPIVGITGFVVGVAWAVPFIMVIGLTCMSSKRNAHLFFIDLGLVAFVTICSLVYSPGNIIPNNIWGGIVIGAWAGGGMSMIVSATVYFSLKALGE